MLTKLLELSRLSKLSKKTIIIISSLVFVLGASGAAVWGLMVEKVPDPAKQTREEVVSYIASDSFSKLDKSKQRQYLDGAKLDFRQMRQTTEGLSDEQRQKLRENTMGAMRGVMEQRMDERLDEFYTLAPEQRTEYLDKMIDEMQNRMSQPRPQRADRPERPAAEGQQNNNRPGGRGFTPERIKRRLESGNPERQARRMEFFEAMRKRMKERGIDFPRRGPGGGGR